MNVLEESLVAFVVGTLAAGFLLYVVLPIAAFGLTCFVAKWIVDKWLNKK